MAATAKDDVKATFKGDDDSILEKTPGKKQNKMMLRQKVMMQLKPPERPQVKLKMVTMQQKPPERPQVKLKMVTMQRRTLEKTPMVKLKVTWITKMLL